jgi:serine/threonine protein kinase
MASFTTNSAFAPDGLYEIDFSERLGDGGQSEVYLGRNTATGDVVIIKKVAGGAKNKIAEEQAMKEVHKMAAIEHPSVPRILACFKLRDERTRTMDLCLVFPYCEAISVDKKMDENSHDATATNGMPVLEMADVFKVFFGILSALHYIHDINIVHRDIKPQNILLPQDGSLIAQLIDFGIATTSNMTTTLCGFSGTFPFQAPEQHRREHILRENLPKLDVWSFGATMVNIITYFRMIDETADDFDSAFADLRDGPWSLDRVIITSSILFICNVCPK